MNRILIDFITTCVCKVKVGILRNICCIQERKFQCLFFPHRLKKMKLYVKYSKYFTNKHVPINNIFDQCAMGYLCYSAPQVVLCWNWQC